MADGKDKSPLMQNPAAGIVSLERLMACRIPPDRSLVLRSINLLRNKDWQGKV
jgi:hypothetical protein